jgi:hypothetical protein
LSTRVNTTDSLRRFSGADRAVIVDLFIAVSIVLPFAAIYNFFPASTIGDGLSWNT